MLLAGVLIARRAFYGRSVSPVVEIGTTERQRWNEGIYPPAIVKPEALSLSFGWDGTAELYSDVLIRPRRYAGKYSLMYKGKPMPTLSDTDAQLLQIVSQAAPASIQDVISIMQKIDALLPNNDGLKWFNKLYLMVTEQVDTEAPADGWEDATWLTRLDVVFASFYVAAIMGALKQDPQTASSWDALFEVRLSAGIDRIQFALAGMNAHINHDLALALLQTNDELHLTPGLQSPEHDDYEQVNTLLEEVLPSALTFLAAGIVGEIAQDTGKIGRLLAIWNVRAARDLAWDFADHLRGLEGVSRDLALEAQDKLTGVIGRALLLVA